VSEGDPVYDLIELRRRIAGSFSAGELRALADSLGVGGINWDRGVQDAAREMVRQCERYAGLPALVARLREEKPLVEWPDPVAPPAAPPGDPHTPGAPPLPATVAFPAPPPLSSSPGTFGLIPPLSSSPGSFGGPPPEVRPPPEAPLTGPFTATAPPRLAPQPSAEPSAPPLFDPYAPPPGPPAVQLPVTAVAASAPAPRAFGSVETPGPPAQPFVWPGTVGPAPARTGPTSGIDPRILVVVAGLMVVAALIAFLAGRASSASAGPEGAPSASASASASPSARPAKADGPAAIAADAIARSFENLARVCELPTSAGTNALVFRRVYERCGPSTPQKRSSSSAPADDGGADAAPPADPGPGRNRRAPRGAEPGQSQPAPAAKGCMGACDSQHGACRSHCGAEPTESTAYESYQRCLAVCLREASRCRLSCR
jgi:hypothetical protein